MAVLPVRKANSLRYPNRQDDGKIRPLRQAVRAVLARQCLWFHWSSLIVLFHCLMIRGDFEFRAVRWDDLSNDVQSSLLPLALEASTVNLKKNRRGYFEAQVN